MAKTVLITGANRGIGAELALTFAKHGNLVLLHGRDREKLGLVAQGVLGLGFPPVTIAGDLRETQVLDRLLGTARTFDADILINNAAWHLPSNGIDLEKMSDDEIDTVLLTNLLSVLKLSKRFFGFFKEKKSGLMVNMNSIIGLEPKHKKSVSCAGKWGLRGFTDSLRMDAAGSGVRIMGVYMSQVKTEPNRAFGWEVSVIAEKIYQACARDFNGNLLLDGRPEEFRKQPEIEWRRWSRE